MDATSATSMVDQGYGDGAAGGYTMVDPAYTNDAYCAEATSDGKWLLPTLANFSHVVIGTSSG